MNLIYYIEINVVCVIVLMLFITQTRQNFERFSTANKIFGHLTRITVLMCVADMIAGICRGKAFFGSRAVIEISNLIFYVALTAISFLWMVYVLIKLNPPANPGKIIALGSIPLMIFTVVALTNPFTHFLFYINEHNLYIRGSGVYFHWLVTWSYLIAATIQILFCLARETNRQKRKEIIPFLYFIVAPAIASVIQMLFYGVTSTQVGVTVSIAFISLSEQNTQMLADALTGLNNRHGLHQYLDNHIQHYSATDLCFFMIDINNFKHINDTFGHMAGDTALVHVACVMKTVCEEAPKKLFVCRYGGDEFLIAGHDCDPEETEVLKARIHEKLEEKNCLKNGSYALSVSIGVAHGKCSDFNEVEHLMRMADEAMYGEKRLSKRQ